MTIKAAIEIFQQKKLECFMVEEKGTFIGVINKSHVMSAYYHNASKEEKIGKFVDSEYIVINANDDITCVLPLGEDKTIAVKDEQERIIGVLTEKLLLNAFIHYISNELSIQDRSGQIQNSGQLNLKHTINNLRYLKNLEKELDEIIEFSADSIYVTDGEGNALRVNKAFEKITGIKRERVLGKNGKELEKEKIFVPSVTPIVLKEKRPVTILQKINRSNKPAIVTGVPIFNEEGKIFRIVLNAKSIDDTELLKNYLLQKEENNQKSDIQDELVYASQHFTEIVELMKKIALVDSTILLTGESGVGKSFLANCIHKYSLRAKKKLIQINCGAIPESLLESELFGYEGGAFTGASTQGKQGLIEMANQGSLFLDEIGSMPLNLQVKLLQVIQNRQIVRVGGTNPIDVDIRIIAATNQNIKKLVEQGRFREDLYYRLNVIPINILPIRKRKDDIYPLTKHFIKKYTKKYDKKVEFMRDAYEEMLQYNWWGNIREIENFVERMVVTNYSGVVTRKDIKDNLSEEEALNKKAINVNRIIPLKEAFREVERLLTIMAYKKQPNSYKMANILGISQSSAHRKIQEHIYPLNNKTKNSIK